MNRFKKLKIEFTLLMAMAYIYLEDEETSFSYFYKAYHMPGNTDFFCHGMALFGMGYCNCRLIISEYTDYTDVNAKMPVISTPELSEAIGWMEAGLKEAYNSKAKLSRVRAEAYCNALGEFGTVLAYAGRFNDAAQMLKRRIDVGGHVLVKSRFGKGIKDKIDYTLDVFYAICLARAGRFDDAMQYYPCKEVLAYILKTLEQTGSSRMDALPYVLEIIESAKNPQGRCNSEDLEYANRWLSDFYQRTGSYVASLAIEMVDIQDKEIGKKKDRNAVSAYVAYARNAIQLGIDNNVEQALAKAYTIAVDELDARVDGNAELIYNIFLLNFTFYFQRDNDRASYFVDRALDFSNKREDVQKREKGEDTELADVDQRAREDIIISKAALCGERGDYKEAYEFSNWVLAHHRRRRQEHPERYKDFFDDFYAETLVQNAVYEIYVHNGRTSQTDKNIQKLMEELAHITDELKQVTPDEMRENFVINIQIWINILLSYWITFPDHTLDAKELYVLELNTKNLSKEIQYLQNRALQKITAVLEDTAISQESRNLQEAYQEAMFGQDELQQEEDEQFAARRISLDAKRYRFLKESDYKFVFYNLESLQSRLGNSAAVLEFRKFEKMMVDIREERKEKQEFLYGAFLVTAKKVVFVSLGDAEQIEEAVAELLNDIEDQSLMDAEKVSSRKLKKAEALLLAPLAKELAGIQGIYIVPDDALYKVPFEIMPMWSYESADFCGIEPEICYLASARSILRDHKGSYEYHSIRIIANPKFQIEESRQVEMEEDEEDFAEWEMEDTRGLLLSSPIAKLPFTEFEAEVVAESFSCKGKSAEVICGREANKNNIFTHQTDVLHFATHGFTMPMRSESAEDEDYAESPYGKRLKRIADSCNPFLRCGLLLAGVDNWLRGAEAEGFGNGLLTGGDILAEHLEGYKLAVLSACDTGDGQISCSGNGIEGLRSAFELAGVPVLLCTLWSVDDFATALFMEAFYGQLHVSGKPLQALRGAKRLIRNLTYADLEERGFASQAEVLYERHMALGKEEKPFGHPRYWAGFILHGAVLKEQA